MKALDQNGVAKLITLIKSALAKLPNPTTKTEAMTQSVGMDSDGRLWTTPSASGGSGGGVNPEEVATIVKEQFPQIKDQFIVTFSSADMKNWTCDKTLAEITEAINSGKEVVGSLMGILNVDFVDQSSNGSVSFGKVFPKGRKLMSYSIDVFEDNVEVTMASIEMTVMGG